MVDQIGERAAQLFEAKRWEESAQLWQLVEDRPEARLGLARVKLAQGHPEEVARTLAEVSPDEPELFLVKIDSLIAGQDWSAAYNACAESERTPCLLRRLAVVLSHQGQTEQAVACLGELPSRQSEDSLRLASWLVDQGQTGPALEVLSELEKAEPCYRLRALQVEARLEVSRGNLETSQKLLTRGGKLAHSYDWPEQEAEFELALARHYLRQSDLEPSRARAHKAVELLRPAGECPQLAVALVMAGELEHRLGGEAEQLFAEAVAVGDLTNDSDIQARARLGLGRYHRSQARSGDALKALGEAV